MNKALLGIGAREGEEESYCISFQLSIGPPGTEVIEVKSSKARAKNGQLVQAMRRSVRFLEKSKFLSGKLPSVQAR